MSWFAPIRLALGWLAQWLVLLILLRFGMSFRGAFAIAALLGLWHLGDLVRGSLWIGVLKFAAFPASLYLARLTQGIPWWIWPLVLAGGAAIYPRLGRGDAPLWRSPRDAVAVIAAALPSAPRTVLDAGCGAGDALVQMSRAWPEATLTGLEASWLLRLVCRLRAPRAHVQGGDMWRESWAAADLVYLFLRPEAMARAQHKCAHELGGEAWVASLEFEMQARATRTLVLGDGRPLWLYRAADLEVDLGPEAG